MADIRLLMTSHRVKGLDSLRAIAALSVLFSHVELQRQYHGLPNSSDGIFFGNTGGHTGVILFYVISGFIITTLLVREKDQLGTISLKKFYTRRILRVWPLYYFVLLISMPLMNYAPDLLTLVLCLTIFPNVAHAMGARWDASPQVWSIGAEEQFYLLWPLIVKYAKRLMAIVILVIIGWVLLQHALLSFFHNIRPDPRAMEFIANFWHNTSFSSIGIGALCGIVYQRHASTIASLKHPMWLVIAGIPFVLWAIGFRVDYVTDELYALLFGSAILIFSQSRLILDIQPLKYLGMISYGLYMYHWMVIGLLLRSHVFTSTSEVDRALFTITPLMVTIGVASLSHYVLERPFLRLKERFKRVS